jgi:hypothetical protein
VLCYAAYIWVPIEFNASAIAASVLACYAYSFAAMRRPAATAKLPLAS